jgi:uncharacterized membrane protein YjdF
LWRLQATGRFCVEGEREVAAPISRRIGNILDTLWYAGSALQTLMVLLALLAVTLGAAAIFPQQPPALQGAAAERWLASTANSYPGLGPFLQSIGAFTISGSLWLRVLAAALAFNVALRLAIQAAALVQVARARRNPPTALESAVRSLPDPVPVWDGAQSTIPATVGPLLAYAGTLVLLGGLFLNGIAGWRTAEIALAPGGSTALDRAGAPWLSLEELTGSDLNPIAHIGLAGLEDERPTSIGLASAGQPIRQGNLWIALRSAGPALQAAARDSLGHPLLLQSLQPGDAGGLSQGEVGEDVHLLFRQTAAEQEFALPSANLTFRVVSYPSLPERGINVPVFLIEVYEGDEPAPAVSDFVVDKAILVLNGSTLDVRRDRYVIVEAAYLPGLIPILLGWLLLFVGVILALWSRPHAEAEPGVESPDANITTEPAHAS